MESKETPFAPASEVPLHRNAPLAPTQELAYRKKCIQLKRRLTEIEANNDSTRRRLEREKQRVKKMRLHRAILLHRLQEIMTVQGTKLTPEQMEQIAALAEGNNGNLAEFVGSGVVPELQERGPEGEGLLDDSSDESEEDEPEVRTVSASRVQMLTRENSPRKDLNGGEELTTHTAKQS